MKSTDCKIKGIVYNPLNTVLLINLDVYVLRFTTLFMKMKAFT